MFHKRVNSAEHRISREFARKTPESCDAADARSEPAFRPMVKSLPSSAGEARGGRDRLVLTGQKIAAGGQPIGHRGQFPVLTLELCWEREGSSWALRKREGFVLDPRKREGLVL
jgi:hypothetical protein